MTHTDLIPRVRALIQEVAPNKPLPEDNSVDLFGHGILDSFATIGLIGTIEGTFNIAVPNEELTLQNFQTVAALVALITRLQK